MMKNAQLGEAALDEAVHSAADLSIPTQAREEDLDLISMDASDVNNCGRPQIQFLVARLSPQAAARCGHRQDVFAACLLIPTAEGAKRPCCASAMRAPVASGKPTFREAEPRHICRRNEVPTSATFLRTVDASPVVQRKRSTKLV